MKKIINFDFRSYFFRVLIINFLSFIYLSKTYAFDFGFISIQSFIYSINIYLVYFFIFFESISALLNEYGLDLNFYKLVLYNLDNLNYKYTGHILYQNINIIYFLIFSIGILFFLERKKFNLNLKFNLYSRKNKFFCISFLIAFILSSINTGFSHQKIIVRVKGLTNTWTENDRVLNRVKYYSQSVKNNILRNDNWYNNIKFSLIYSDTMPSGDRRLHFIDKVENFQNFGKIIDQKNYNNIYVIINESYPNFRDKNLKKNLFEKIVSNNNHLRIQKFKKKWNRSVTTQGAEMEFFCNKKVDLNDFMRNELEYFLEKNSCWITSKKNKNLVYIHSYQETYFNRSRYKKFFNKTYFKHDLLKLGLKRCQQKFDGICDHEVINNMNKFVDQENNNFVIFLTLNNHIPIEPVTKKNYLDCEKTFPLNLNKQFCTIYNNQMFFNENLSNFLRTMNKNDLMVFFSDTPPMFNKRRRIHFEDTIDVYFFSKK